jgi:hypothetical protein
MSHNKKRALTRTRAPFIKRCGLTDDAVESGKKENMGSGVRPGGCEAGGVSGDTAGYTHVFPLKRCQAISYRPEPR